MEKKIEQNHILNVKKYLYEGKIELGVKVANELIKNKVKPFELSKVIAAKNGLPSPIDCPRSAKPLSQNFCDLIAFFVFHFFIVISSLFIP